MVDLKKIYQRKDDMVWRVIGSETVLVPVRQKVDDLENVYCLNETAAFIWSLIDGKKTVGDIRDRMLKEFNVEPEQLTGDLVKVISQLEEIHGIEEISSGEATGEA